MTGIPLDFCTQGPETVVDCHVHKIIDFSHSLISHFVLSPGSEGPTINEDKDWKKGISTLKTIKEGSDQ